METITIKGKSHIIHSLHDDAVVFQTGEGELYTEHFSVTELRCKCVKCMKQKPHKMKPEALAKMEGIRFRMNRAFSPTSAYRCAEHPEEAKKVKKGKEPGQHNKGVAMDIPVYGGAQRYQVVQEAIKAGARGIGVANSFVHIDWREGEPMSWKY